MVPIRSFDGLTRLSSVLDTGGRAALMQHLACHTVDTIRQAEIWTIVVSSDPDVAAWASGRADSVIPESSIGGLDGAAASGVSAVDGPWLVVHADLPAVSATDIRAAAQLATDGTVLAPSHDGGTSLIGGCTGAFPFSYGPGSFRRHLSAARGTATILVRAGLALDLDRPWDLAALTRLAHL